MKSIDLIKVEATGNDFLIYDSRANAKLGRRACSTLAPQVCDRHFGIGADGFIVIKEIAKAHWRWEFFNSDGSEAEMCGNASRAVGNYIISAYKLKSLVLDTVVGPVRIARDGNMIRSIIDTGDSRPQPYANRLFSIWLTNTGVPHAVVYCRSIDIIHKQVPLIQKLRGLGRGGHNVTFVTPKGQTVTFERGVEDFTLSCGTGMIAAAQVLRLKSPKRSCFPLSTPGGRARVEFLSDGTTALIGPARTIAQIRFQFHKRQG